MHPPGRTGREGPDGPRRGPLAPSGSVPCRTKLKKDIDDGAPEAPEVEHTMSGTQMERRHGLFPGLMVADMPGPGGGDAGGCADRYAHGLTQRSPRSVRQAPGRRRCGVARHTAGGGVRPAQERAGVKTSALFRGSRPELISQVPNPPLRAGTATAQGGGVTCSSPTRPDPSPYGPGSGTEAECDDRLSAARIRCSGLPTVYAAAGSPLPCSLCSWQCSAVLLSESKSGTPTA